MTSYKKKYHKYKIKYLQLLNGGTNENTITDKHRIINIKPEIKKRMFPLKENLDYDQLKVNKESLYSSSRIEGAQLIINIIKSYFNKPNITVTDGTSNVGTDAITLALAFNKVNAIELIDKNCEILKHNVNVYNLKNVDVHCGDSLKLIPNLKQDVIFVDPPWGGTSYKKHEIMNLYLSDNNIANIVADDFINMAKLVLVKVPRNYNFDLFFNKNSANNIKIYSYKKNNHVFFYLIAVTKK